MTMTASPTTDPQVEALLSQLRGLATQVQTIDAELGTEVSGPIAARNKLAAQYVAAQNGNEDLKTYLDSVVGNIEKHFSSSPELQVAVFTAAIDALTAKFGASTKDFLTKQVDAQPKQEVTGVTDARKVELSAQRTKAVGMFKGIKDLLKFYDVLALPSDITEPSARRGAIVRGAKFNTAYQYFVDGKLQQMTADDGTKSDASLANLVLSKWAKDLNWKTKDLRDYIIAQLGATVKDDNSVDLPNDWSVNLPAPHADMALRGIAVSNPTLDESEDDDDNGTTEDNFASV